MTLVTNITYPKRIFKKKFNLKKKIVRIDVYSDFRNDNLPDIWMNINDKSQIVQECFTDNVKTMELCRPRASAYILTELLLKLWKNQNLEQIKTVL